MATIIGTSGADTLTGTGDDDTIQGLGGDDSLFAKVAGTVVVEQRAGNRYVSVTPAA